MATHVGSSPDEVADALKTKPRIIDEKGNGVDTMRGIGRASGNKLCH
jgi:hypothetical protein